MELSAVSLQRSANLLFFLVLADRCKLRADGVHSKTVVFGWALAENLFCNFIYLSGRMGQEYALKKFRHLDNTRIRSSRLPKQ